MTMPSPDRLEQVRRAIDDYPRRLAEATRRVQEAASQVVTSTAYEGQVVVTLTAGGEIESVRVTWRALRELDRKALAHYVTAAVNDGLQHADALLAAERAGDAGGSLDETLDQFERHVDDLLGEVDRLDRQLDRPNE